MKDYVELDGMKIWKASATKLYQGLCNKVFGKDAVKIEDCAPNHITELLRYVDDVTIPGPGGFYDIWDTRGVKVLTFRKKFEARLMRLRERMQTTPNYLVLLDTVKQVADPANGNLAYAKLAAWDVMWYEEFSHLKSLDSFSVGLLEDPKLDRRKVLPIAWDYDPYQMAFMAKDLIKRKFGDDIVKKGKKLVVLVKVPWVSEENRFFDPSDYVFYRSLARRTFMEYKDDEISRKLGGIIVVDERRMLSAIAMHSRTQTASGRMTRE